MADTTALVPVFSGVISNTSTQLCDARTLHAFMQVRRDFTTWIKARIRKFGFMLGEDFITVQNLSSPDLVSAKARAQKLSDYHLTLDMAKELAMVENNEQGRAARRYFIECERKALSLAAPQHPAYAVNPGDTLTQAQADELRDLMEHAAQKLPPAKRGAFLQSGWAKLKKHTGVNYRQIPQSAHADALSLLARHTVDWELVDEEPAPKLSLDDTARLDMAFRLASNAAAQVQRTVFNAVMSGKALESLSSQWMLYFHQKNWGDKSMDAYCKPLAMDAICLGPDAYLANLERGDGHVLTTDQLARMAEFSTKRLAYRARQNASKSQTLTT